MNLLALTSLVSDARNFLGPEPLLEDPQSGQHISFNVHTGSFPALVDAAIKTSLRTELLRTYAAFENTFTAALSIDSVLGATEMSDIVRQFTIGSLCRSFISQALSGFENIAAVLIACQSTKISQLTSTHPEEHSYLQSVIANPNFLSLIAWSQRYPDSFKTAFNDKVFHAVQACDWIQNVSSKIAMDSGLTVQVNLDGDRILLSFAPLVEQENSQINQSRSADVAPSEFINKDGQFDLRLYGGTLIGCQIAVNETFSSACLDTLQLKGNNRHAGSGNNSALIWLNYATENLPALAQDTHPLLKTKS